MKINERQARWFAEDPSRWDALSDFSKQRLRRYNPHEYEFVFADEVEVAAIVVNAIKSGATYTEAASKVGVSTSVARTLAKKAGVQSRARGPRGPNESTELIAKALKEGASRSDMAKATGLTRSHIGYVARAHGVFEKPGRPKGSGRPSERTEMIVKALREGVLTRSDVVKATGLTRSRIQQIAAAHDIPARDFQKEQRRESVIEAIKSGASYLEVARLLHMSINQVRDIAKAAGVKFVKNTKRQQIEKLLNEGNLRQAEIARRVGANQNYVSRIAISLRK